MTKITMRHNCRLKGLFAWVCGTTTTVLFYHDNGTLTVTQELCLPLSWGPRLWLLFVGCHRSGFHLLVADADKSGV
jgi:hypothetical protein